MAQPQHLLEVWLDCDLRPPCLVGLLAHDRGQLRFHYERSWLQDPLAFALDPDLSLDDAPFFPRPELGNFGIFLDSTPDRWGQTLMKRREALQAVDDQRSPRTLYAWDFLNVAIGNRDDHLRNHGFVLQATGWRLAPAFDLNPNSDKAEHVLNIDDADNRPSLGTVVSTASFYGLTSARGSQIIEEVASVVDAWPDAAQKLGLSRAEVALSAAAFAAHAAYRANPQA